MRYGLTFCTVLGLAVSGSFAQLSAQIQPPQTALLVGRVQDEFRRAIEGVEVIVNRREVRATTDQNGLFTVRVTPTDSTVAFRRIGYRPMLLALRPLPPSRDTILVELRASQVQLPELIVSAPPTKPVRYAGTTKYDEVFLRRRVGLGTLITREAIDLRFGSSTAELLQGIAGVNVWNGPPKRIRFARCPEPGGIAVFIDGWRQLLPGASPPGHPSAEDEAPEIEVLSRIHPADIEMIEVYRGASQIPGVFHWDGCAVVAIWTRWN